MSIEWRHKYLRRQIENKTENRQVVRTLGPMPMMGEGVRGKR